LGIHLYTGHLIYVREFSLPPHSISEMCCSG